MSGALSHQGSAGRPMGTLRSTQQGIPARGRHRLAAQGPGLTSRPVWFGGKRVSNHVTQPSAPKNPGISREQPGAWGLEKLEGGCL